MLFLSIVSLVTIAVIAHAGNPIPADWEGRVASHNAFFANDDDGVLDSTGYPKGLYLVSERFI